MISAIELKARVLHVTERIVRWRGDPTVLRILHDIRDQFMTDLAEAFDVWTWIAQDERVEFVTRFTWEVRSESWLQDRISCYFKIFKEAA